MQKKKSANPLGSFYLFHQQKCPPSPPPFRGHRKWLRGRREHKGMGSGCTRLYSHACILALHPVILPLPYLLFSHLLRLPACVVSSLRSRLPPLLSPARTHARPHARARARKDTCLRARPRLPQINGEHSQTLEPRARTHAEKQRNGLKEGRRVCVSSRLFFLFPPSCASRSLLGSRFCLPV